MRPSGTKAHLSKDGTPEHVLFTKLPFVKNGNPNTPESIAKLKQFGSYLQQEIGGAGDGRPGAPGVAAGDPQRLSGCRIPDRVCQYLRSQPGEAGPLRTDGGGGTAA